MTPDERRPDQHEGSQQKLELIHNSPATEPAIEMPMGLPELALISERNRSFLLLQRRFR
ncbi:MAG TPA: hypothetical protein VL919_07085 [Vicinamibacterales bacterium]|nr:hypothetical protein [Vicinamibacterales bacterium]